MTDSIHSAAEGPEQAGSLPDATPNRRPRMSFRTRLLFFGIAWLIVLMPFLFWWSTWFGRQLSDAKLNEYLHDANKPRHIQHALVQLSDRMSRKDPVARKYYPAMVALASNPSVEIRNTDAWAMGQDTSVPEFHQALLNMLQDPALMVRGNAALALVRFGDASGRPQIVSLLQSANVVAPAAGKLTDTAKPGTAVREGGLIAKVQSGSQALEARSPLTGRVALVNTPRGAAVAAGAQLAVVDPGESQLWEALRALYVVGTADDLPVIARYEREQPGLSDRIRQQAILTEHAIRQRAENQ
jgi:biotin carboxyl carrier protein